MNYYMISRLIFGILIVNILTISILNAKTNPNKKFGIDSLNVSNAASIAQYEYFKKFRA